MGEYKYQLAGCKPSAIETSDMNTLFTRLSVEFDDRSVPTFFRERRSDLASLRSLHEDRDIILFTPAVPNLSGEDMDPFEPLGRALSVYHPRVKHVPYTKDGFTSAHRDFLAFAGGIILALADPAPHHTRATHGSGDRCGSLKSQLTFGAALLKVLKDCAMPVPLVTVVCADIGGANDGNEATKIGPDTFGTVLQAKGYDDKTLRDVARAVFFQV